MNTACDPKCAILWKSRATEVDRFLVKGVYVAEADKESAQPLGLQINKASVDRKGEAAHINSGLAN